MNSTASPTATPGRRLAAWLLAVYCAFTVAMGLPDELSPSMLQGIATPVRNFLDDHGYNPWHFVFPGRRGTTRRRNVAVRYTGITTDGERVVLHEAPPGLTGPPVRIFDDARTTVSIKIFSLAGIGRVMLERDAAGWDQAIAKLRTRGPVKRSIVGFCSSKVLNGGRQLASVELDLFTAGISYETGEQYGRAARLLQTQCDTGSITTPYGEAPNKPDWPGVDWRGVR